MSQSYLDTLNKEQRVAAEHKDGPLLVLAGAGSGKTYTMTVRMKHLIEYHKIRPETILGITFTVKAAREMQERAEKLIGHQGRLINLSTFHSLCVKILRKDIYHLKESKASTKSDKGYDSSFTILDTKDQLQLVKECMKELEIDPKEHSPQAFLGWISSFKNELMSPAVVEKCMALDGNPFATYFQFPPYLDMNKSISMARRVPKIYHGLVLNTYKRYMDKLVANNSCDFDDLIFLTARLLMEAPTVLGFYQEKFRYIMIDEYQDTNHAQYILAKLLAAKYRNIAVVGDDFQCFLPETLIRTANGEKRIDRIKPFEEIIVAKGDGLYTTGVVEEVSKKPYEGIVYTIKTSSGKTVKGTSGHTMFAVSPEDTFASFYFTMIEDGELCSVRGAVNKEQMEQLSAEFPFNVSQLMEDKYLLEISGHYHEIWRVAEKIRKYDYSIVHQAKVTNVMFDFTSIENIKKGYYVPVYTKAGFIAERVVEVIQEEYTGYVYDLNIPDYHNYVADSIVVHNCIYGFRNADIRNILEFEKDYEGAKLVKLERNYRSTQQILERANRVIAHNTNQRKKTLWTDKTDGEEVIYHVCEDNYAEAEYVAQQIMMMRHKRDFKDFTILYRVNAQSRTFEEVFMKHGIPYDLVGAVNFYDRREIKDIIAYLRVLQNPDEEISLKRIINTPKRGIGQSSVDKMLAYAKENDISLWESLKLADFYLPKATAKKVAGFMDLMNNLKAEAENLPVGMLVDVIIEDSGYREELKKQNNTDAEDRIQNLNEFLNVAWEYQQQEEESSIQGLLERITLSRAEEEEKPEEEKDFVRLMTIHGSKGLEFPVVFGVGIEENILPYYKSIAEDNVEEERRLCYVLATRAKEQLYFLRARQRVVFNDIQMNEPSRFLKEMGFSEPESNNKNYVLPW